MGFDVGYYENKKAVVAEILRDYEKMPVEVMAHTTTKEGLWMAVRRFETDEKYIAFYLIERRGKGEYAVKGMSEACHPYYYTCPLKMLAMVPVANADWRKGVLEYRRRLNHKYQPGDLCSIHDKVYRVRTTYKKGYLVERHPDGKVFKGMPEDMVPNDAVKSA